MNQCIITVCMWVCGGKRIILWSQFFPSTSTWAPDRPQTVSLVGQALYLFWYLIDQKNLFLSYCNFIWYFKSSFLTRDSVNINAICKNSSNLQNLRINKETWRGEGEVAQRFREFLLFSLSSQAQLPIVTHGSSQLTEISVQETQSQNPSLENGEIRAP